MNPRYAPVARRSSHRCEYCQAPEAIFNLPFGVEHIVPAGRGGSEDLSNLALSCRACNLRKSDHLEAIDPATHTVVSLFHPRKQRWEERLSLEQSTGRLLGLTATGRATIGRLQMNRPEQLAARQQWMRLKIFP